MKGNFSDQIHTPLDKILDRWILFRIKGIHLLAFAA